MKKILSLLIAFVFVVTAFPITAFAAADADVPTVSVESVSAFGGESVDVNVSIANNPGIISAVLSFEFSEGLTLTGAANGEAFSALSMTKPGKFVSPCNFVWDAAEVSEEDIKDGTILTLTFDVAEGLEEGAELYINVSYTNGNIIDNDLNTVNCNTVGGTVCVINYVPGDVNNDGLVSTLDLVYFRRYMAGGYDLDFVEEAADVNADGSITVTDLIYVRRYLAGGYGIELLPSKKPCDHVLSAVEAKEPTCTEDGNTAYWVCSECERIFSDEQATSETALAATVIEATGHTVVIDDAVEPTYESVGYTEGSHCSTCNLVIKAQVEIPKLTKQEYSITYHIANNDTYLAGVDIENPNASTYSKEEGIEFADLIVPGYVFEGWYDGAGSNGTLVKSYPAGTTGNKTLYAKWTKTEYTVQFESELIPEDSITYTVDQGAVLPSPKLDGYIFVGWSDEEGDVIKKIPAGTIGTKIYKANWLSERNQAWAYEDVGEPMVYEDDGVILLIYEIGEIRNVPLYVINDFGKINSDGVEKEVTKEFTFSTSKTEIENYTETVSKATTESFGWTLSNEWSDSVSVSEEWAEEHGLTVSEAEELCTNESNNWYVSSGSSGTDTTETVSSTDSSLLYTTTKNNKNYSSSTDETRQDYSAESTVNSKVSSEVSAEYMGVEASVSAEVSAGLTTKQEVGYTSSSTSGKESESGSSAEAGKVTTSGTNTTNSASWNSESGCGGSSSVTNTSSVSTAIAETISQKTGYGKEYIQTENQENTMDTSASTESGEEYSSGVSYSIEMGQTVTETYRTTNTKSGYHRWIMAGTAHVFAVVGYDIATDSYFVTNYSVMDDEVHQFEDYSYSYSSYDDNQNSVIPFEVPDDIEYYVHERIGKTQGLEVSASGVITNYTGTDEMVIIPEYTVVENLDGTKNVIKITGISATAFAGKDHIKAVIMSDFITDIPNSAFKKCTSLLYFEGESIETIGQYAFAGCSALTYCALGENVTGLGTGAFEGMDTFVIKASDASIVNAALASGAKNIVIGVGDSCTNLCDMTLVVPEGTESFTFYGYGKTFNDLFIESNAVTTNIYRAIFNSTSKAPLKLSSENVTLQEVVVKAPEIALALSANTTNLALYGESNVICDGEKAMLSKSIVFSQVKEGYYSHITVAGNVLRFGTYTNEGYLTVIDGCNVMDISEETFNKYLAGVFTVTFDATGGTVAEAQRACFYGTAMGALPVPTRDYYTFVGWYTAAEGGNEVAAETVLDSYENITLYAHWELNPLSDWVLVSEVPENAEIVSEKWTYDLTTNITSDVAEVEGYELYDTTSEWGEYGEWSDWSTTVATASDSVEVQKKTVTDTAAYTKYTYYIYRTSDGYGYGTLNYQTDSHGKCTKYDEISLNYKLSLKEDSTYLYGPYNSSMFSHSYDCYWFYKGSTYVPAVTHQEYSYRVRELIYTYYLTKTESLESETEVTEDESISNVYKWVQYRVK